MSTRAGAFVASASLAFGLAAANPALAKQTPEPSATAGSEGLDASRSLRMPSSLFRIDRDDQTQQAAASGKETPAQGAVPQPTRASQATPQFRRAAFSKVVGYGFQLTGYVHVMRLMAQDFTRSQLSGNFWQDYVNSIHVPKTWGDKDGWEVNYLGHAIFGSAYSRIWIEQREPKATTKSQYFKSMGHAFVFTTIMSVQYEIGPLSEASIGNVGINPRDLGWCDYVWTPIGATLWMMAEDAIDKYFLTFVDKHVPFVMARTAARLILNPGHMLANVSQNRLPWYRQGRPLTGGR